MNEKINELLNSDEANAVVVLAAYVVRTTSTTKDDEILEASADYSELIAEKLKEAADLKPTSKDAIKAVSVLLESISKETKKTKIDDIISLILKRFV